MTVLDVTGVLGGMAALLWLSSILESHQLGQIDQVVSSVTTVEPDGFGFTGEATRAA